MKKYRQIKVTKKQQNFDDFFNLVRPRIGNRHGGNSGFENNGFAMKTYPKIMESKVHPESSSISTIY